MKKGGDKKEMYDVVVIGSGSAGMSAAFAAKEAGARVVMIEREKLGGECPNWACVPSKAILRSAKAYRHAKEAGLFGVNVSRVGYDFADVMRYRGDVVDRVTGGGEHGDRYVDLAKKMGIDVVYGEAGFVGKHMVRVGSQKIEGKTFVISTGTENFVPPIEGLEGAPFWGFKDVMQLTKQPKSLVVIGGGPVGCELATFFASFGTKVDLVQGAPVVLNREDMEISALAHKALEKTGMRIHTNARASKVVYKRGVFQLFIEGQQKPIEAAHLLLATGKRPATDKLGLEKLKLKLNPRGYLMVNTQQASSLSHVFAAGDITGGMQFTHTAHPAGDVAGYNAAMLALGTPRLRTGSRQSKASAGKNFRKIDMRVVPRVTFTYPEVASVGMTEEEAKKKHKKLLVGSFQVGALGRAVTDHARVGLVKLVADAKTKKIVGGHIMAERAGEMIHEVALAIRLGAKMDDLAEMIHAFPTYSEAIAAAAASAKMK